jgi:hypothetical protein
LQSVPVDGSVKHYDYLLTAAYIFGAKESLKAISVAAIRHLPPNFKGAAAEDEISLPQNLQGSLNQIYTMVVAGANSMQTKLEKASETRLKTFGPQSSGLTLTWRVWNCLTTCLINQKFALNATGQCLSGQGDAARVETPISEPNSVRFIPGEWTTWTFFVVVVCGLLEPPSTVGQSWISLTNFAIWTRVIRNAVPPAKTAHYEYS